MIKLCPECGKKFTFEVKRCGDCGTRLVTITITEDPLIGLTIDDRFTITDRIAAGGMGAVYKAYQPSIDRHIAVKVLHPKFVGNEQAIQRFFREAKAVSRLSHHNIVQIYDFGQSADGMLYMMMEYLDGNLLRDLMDRGPVLPARTVEILGQVCDALSVAHRRGIIHRDLKPENIFILDRTGAPDFVKVFDFGLVKMLGTSTYGPMESLTAADQFFGTPHYMSPEQSQAQPLDHRTDIYSLGIILFEMLTGAPPFDADTPMAMLIKHVQDPPPSLIEACTEFVLPPQLEEIFGLLVAKDRDKRPAAEEVKELLFACFEETEPHGDAAPRRRTQRLRAVKSESRSISSTYTSLTQMDLLSSKFLEIVVHEIKTPLTVVRSGADLLASGALGEISEKQGQFLNMMNRNLRRLTNFSTDVLDISRLDSGNYNLSPRRLLLGKALTKTVKRLREELKRDEIAINLDLGVAADLQVFADPHALARVLGNLVDNAWLHLSGAGQVTVGCRPLGDAHIEVSVSVDCAGKYEQDLEKVFDRYYQPGSENTVGLMGTGIRLSLCKALVEKMAGKIKATPEPSGGTAFRFTLPRVSTGRLILFGPIAETSELVSAEELRSAIVAQRTRTGPHMRLGEILVEQGAMSPEAVKKVLHLQRTNLARPHAHLPTCLMDGLFGRTALKYIYVTEEQLNRCVSLQAEAVDNGVPSRLGQILLQRNYMTEEEVLSILSIQKIRIVSCPGCKSRYNIIRSDRRARLHCPRCGGALNSSAQPDGIGVAGDIS